MTLSSERGRAPHTITVSLSIYMWGPRASGGPGIGDGGGEGGGALGPTKILVSILGFAVLPASNL